LLFLLFYKTWWSSIGHSYYSISGQGYMFYLNFCGMASKSCNGKDHPSVIYMDSSTCNALGKLDKSSMTLLNEQEPDAGVRFTYTEGDKMFGSFQGNTVVDLNCNRDVSPDSKTIAFVAEDVKPGQITYRFSLTTPYACPGYGDGGSGSSNSFWALGIGATVLTIGAVFTVLYFVIGALVMKFALKKTGIEIIPNVYFWKELPFLLKDGVMLIVDGIKALIGKIRGTNAYAEVK